MPVEPRAEDQFTKGNILLGFSQITFQPRDASTGALGAAVSLGILSSEELAKDITRLELPDGAAGTITVAREVLSSLKPFFNIETFNFRSDIAQYIFGAAQLTVVVVDAAAVITDEPIDIPVTNPFDAFVPLINGEITESSVAVSCATITAEAVGVGDGTSGSGAVSGDFDLDFKVKAVADVTLVTVTTTAGVVTTFTAVASGAASSGNEVEVIVGESDTLSGDLQFHVAGSPVDVTGSISATYKPSFTTAAGDIVNATTDAGQKSSSDTVVFAVPGGGANSTATRTVGSWLTEGFAVGQNVIFSGTTSNDGIQSGKILVLSALVMEFADAVLSVEGAVAAEAVGFGDGGDFVFDPLIGQIRFVNAGVDLSPFRPAASAGGQPMLISYTFSQNSGVSMKPFTQGGGAFEGAATIKHLPDVGVNFIWTIPSVTIHINDDSLTFGSDDFATGTLEMVINDSGGDDRFGTLVLSSEAESAS